MFLRFVVLSSHAHYRVGKNNGGVDKNVITSSRRDFIDSSGLCSRRKCQLMLIMFLRSSGNDRITSFNLFLSWIWVISFRCRSSLSISSILFFIFKIISTTSTSSLPFSHSCMFCNNHLKKSTVVHMKRAHLH